MRLMHAGLPRPCAGASLRSDRSRRKAGAGMLCGAILAFSLAFTGGATAQQADADEATLVLVRPGNGGPAADLRAFEVIVGGETIETASDFGFLQESGDGYAILGVRTRIGPDGLTSLPCEGGLAPASLTGAFEGAYLCTGEIPVPLSYQPKTGVLMPNLIDPNGVWEDDTFFVSSLMSIRVTPARPVGIPAEALRPLTEEVPDTLDGLTGRVAPPAVQASGACGDDIAVFFPLAGLPACADAGFFEQE